MKKINLTQKKFALVDDEDFVKVSRFKWHARKDKNTFYASRGVYLGKVSGKYKSTIQNMHRFILQIEDSDIKVDHKNGNGLDNRKENLRIATNQQNGTNTHSLKANNTSGYRGVSIRKDASRGIVYRARVYLPNGKRKSLGSFDSAEAAAIAFDKAAQEVYGDFCGDLNFKRRQ